MNTELIFELIKRIDKLEAKVKKLESNQKIGEPALFGVQRFEPPNLPQVKQYCKDRANSVDAESFIDFYESKGWMIGKNKMKDWQSAIRTWEKKAEPTNVMPMQKNRIDSTNDYIAQVEKNSSRGVPMPESLRKRFKNIGNE